MGMLKTLVLGRENGIRSKIRDMILGGSSADTSPDSAYSAPRYTPPTEAAETPRPDSPRPDSPRPEPPREVTPSKGFEVVLHKDALHPGELVEVIVAGTAICVGNVDGTYHAIANTCLHAEGPLGEGTLEGTVVTCPYHGWTYDITDGSCITNADTKVQTFEVVLKADAVCVRL